PRFGLWRPSMRGPPSGKRLDSIPRRRASDMSPAGDGQTAINRDLDAGVQTIQRERQIGSPGVLLERLPLRVLRRLAAWPSVAIPKRARCRLDHFRTDRAEPGVALLGPAVRANRVADRGIVAPRMIPADRHQGLAIDPAIRLGQEFIDPVAAMPRRAGEVRVLDRPARRRGPVIAAPDRAVARAFGD